MNEKDKRQIESIMAYHDELIIRAMISTLAECKVIEKEPFINSFQETINKEARNLAKEIEEANKEE